MIELYRQETDVAHEYYGSVAIYANDDKIISQIATVCTSGITAHIVIRNGKLTVLDTDLENGVRPFPGKYKARWVDKPFEFQGWQIKPGFWFLPEQLEIEIAFRTQ